MLAAVFRPPDQNAPRKIRAKQSCWLYPREYDPDADKRPGAVWLYSELWSSPDVEAVEPSEVAENREIFQATEWMIFQRISWEGKLV